MVIGVASDAAHNFGKRPQARVRLIAGLGIEGDAHAGVTVQHLSRMAKTPEAPNLRQVHLIHSELFGELAESGHDVRSAQLGENITTLGIDLLGLPCGTQLRLGECAVVELTGLRNPCRQIDDNIGKGAMAATLDRGADGELIRKAGVMAIVLQGGEVAAGDAIELVYTPGEHRPLEPV